MLGKTVLAMIASLSLNAMAADGGGKGSQFLYQAPVDKIQLTPALTYLSLTAKLKGAVTKLESSGYTGALRSEYGISDMFSAGATLSYTSLKNEYSPAGVTASTDSKGLDDIRFFLLGRMDQAASSFRFGTDVNFSLSKSITEADSDTNRASGGISLEPFVGYEMYWNACTVGTKLAYKLYAGDRKAEDKSATPTTTSDVSGGETVTWSAFYEHDMKPWTLGVSLDWESEAKDKEDTNGTVTTSAGQSIMTLTLYAPYEVSESLTVYPLVNYGKYTAFDTASIESANSYAVQVKGRFTF